jgi:hypothetical protein
MIFVLASPKIRMIEQIKFLKNVPISLRNDYPKITGRGPYRCQARHKKSKIQRGMVNERWMITRKTETTRVSDTSPR